MNKFLLMISSLALFNAATVNASAEGNAGDQKSNIACKPAAQNAGAAGGAMAAASTNQGSSAAGAGAGASALLKRRTQAPVAIATVQGPQPCRSVCLFGINTTKLVKKDVTRKAYSIDELTPKDFKSEKVIVEGTSYKIFNPLIDSAKRYKITEKAKLGYLIDICGHDKDHMHFHSQL